MENLVTKLEKTIILFLSLWVFLIFRNKIIVLDNIIYLFLIGFKNGILTNIIKVFTYCGSAYVFIPLTICILILLRNNRISNLITINLILSFLSNQLLKRIFRRPRPIFIHLVKEGGFSFPSGHAMVSFCFYGFIIYLIHRSNIKNKKKYEILLSLLILIIGLTRIYLGVHYFSDIIGGFGFGLLYLSLFIRHIKLK